MVRLRTSCMRFLRQIAHRALLRRQDGSGRQYPQSQQVGQVTRVGFVAAVLESFVLLDRRGVGQMHLEACRLQTIDQPVPVEGRFDHDAGQLVAPGQKQLQESSPSRWATRFSATTRSSSSVTVTTLLFECRSIPLYFISASRWLKQVRKLTLTPPPLRRREAG